nr:MAG TPA: hypothetical protein [Caudoviricetes sp.]
MKTNIIATALPLVYRKDNEFEVLDGLDMNRKKELWGTQLSSGIMLSLAGEVFSNWEEIKKFAEKMHFNGKPGSLPSKDHQRLYWGVAEKEKLDATGDILEKYGIYTWRYSGRFWCSEEYDSFNAYTFELETGWIDYAFKSKASCFRVAVAFY